ncbi:hypothetical protein NC653_001023 [Populus alba x Populus x berolinensis]|uniref:Uncharacterized protein n=1 Tax=Populus alba x Populus x berolinensis TaxID=444605 RepID=A0AAD6WHB9_9ROSI|nr:hypothetical protein NC653_001023 [Populus alba x Populus x berolinensis]
MGSASQSSKRWLFKPVVNRLEQNERETKTVLASIADELLVADSPILNQTSKQDSFFVKSFSAYDNPKLN